MTAQPLQGTIDILQLSIDACSVLIAAAYSAVPHAVAVPLVGTELIYGHRDFTFLCLGRLVRPSGLRRGCLRVGKSRRTPPVARRSLPWGDSAPSEARHLRAAAAPSSRWRVELAWTPPAHPGPSSLECVSARRIARRTVGTLFLKCRATCDSGSPVAERKRATS